MQNATHTRKDKMTLKYCQSHKCHTYDTKDRKRGSKDNRTNQTRRRSEFHYGGGNFCSLNWLLLNPQRIHVPLRDTNAMLSNQWIKRLVYFAAQ